MRELFPKLELPRSTAPRVSVIIPAKATPELLGACLRSLSHFAPDRIPYEVIVVLNEATSRTETSLRRMVTGVEVVTSRVNLGLAGAGNRARSIARGDYLVILHDDAEIEPGWLEALVETADAHPEAGAVGSKVLFPDGRLQSAGMILWRDAYAGPPWAGQTPAPTDFDRLDRLRAVDFCGTSSLLVRAAAWDAVGGLDERFYPVYYVDVDLSMALRRLGLVVLYEPRARVRHHKAASTTARFGRFVFEANRRRFIEKWGAALDGHEPPAGYQAAAVERAMARAETFASQVRQRQIPPLHPALKSAQFDPLVHEHEHRKKSRSLRKAYIAYLIKRGWPWIHTKADQFLRRATKRQ